MQYFDASEATVYSISKKMKIYLENIINIVEKIVISNPIAYDF